VSKTIRDRILKPTKSEVKELFSCYICGKTANSYWYEYIAISVLWLPENDKTPNKACRQCIYKSKFGSKNFKKKMKEGILDE